MNAPATSRFDAVASTTRRLIAEVVRRPLEDVSLDASIDGAELVLESTALVKLNAMLEEHFNVTLPDFALANPIGVRSARDVVQLVLARIADRAGHEGAP